MHDISECAGCRLCRSMAGLKPKSPVPCSFFLENCCRYSKQECGFTHLRFEEIPPCRSKNCRFGPEKCLFWHDPVPKSAVVLGNVDVPQCPDGDGECPTLSSVQPPVPAKKKKRRRRNKKKNKNNRLVESPKQDSQSISQNPFQPLSSDDESDTEGESDSDSLHQETNHHPVQPVDVVNAPSSVINSFVEEEKKEIEETEIPASESKISHESKDEKFSIREEGIGSKISPYCCECSELIQNSGPYTYPPIKCIDCPKELSNYFWYHYIDLCDPGSKCKFAGIRICYDCIRNYGTIFDSNN